MNQTVAVLVATDDQAFAQLCIGLLGQEHCEVWVANTGQKALQLTRERRPDLIVLEEILPGLKGDEVCRLIKADPSLQDRSVILVVSPASGAEPAMKRRVTPADAQIVKTGDTTDLLPQLRAFLSLQKATAALRASEERFRQLAENIREVFWMTNPEKTEMLYISPGYEEIWGRTCESLYAAPMNWVEAIHPEDRQRVLDAALTQQLRGDYDQEYRIVRPDGSTRWIHDRAFPIRNATGEIYRLVGIAEDITKRKQSENKELTLAHAVQTTSEPICITDLQDRFIFVNRAFEQAYGYSEGEVLGETPGVLFSNKNRPGLMSEILARTRQGGWKGEVIDRRKDGTEFPVFLSTSEIKDPGGRVLGLMGVARDISERKLAEKQIRLLADALQSAQEFISITNAKNRFIFVNSGFLKAYGYEEEEVLDKTPHFLYSQKNPPGLCDQILEQTLAGGWKGELLNRTSDGREFPIWLSTSPIKGRDGGLLGLLGVARDISLEKRAAKEQRAFSELGYRLSVAAEPTQAAQTILEIAASLFDWDAAYLHLFSAADGRVVRILTIDTIDGKHTPVPESSPTLIPGPLMQAVMKDGARLINPGDESPLAANLVLFGNKARPSASKMYVPINSGGTVLGILSVQSYTPHRYSREDLGLLESLAHHCGDALERIKVAEAWRQAEAKYRAIFENATEGIFQTTPDGRYLSANPALARILGYESPEELLSKVSDIERQIYVSPQRRHEFMRLLEAQGSVQGFEAEQYRKDGSRFWLRMNARCVRDTNGSVLYYEGTSRDVTERKRTQQRLSDALELNLTILATSSIGILAYRASGQCIFANGAAGRIIGATPEKLLELNFRELRCWKDSGLLAMAEKALQSRTSQSGEIHMVTQFGKELWMDCQMSAFVSAGDLHLLFVLSEITQRKRSEEELRRWPLRIIEAQEAERLRVSRELHDSVNQLIASAKMRLGRVERGLASVKPSAREILRRCDDLLTLALEENRRIAQGLHPSDLDELGFTTACRNFCAQFRKRTGLGLKCTLVNLPQRLPAGHELNLFRIAQEALNNIEKHANASRISLRITLRKGWLRLEIRDNGAGAPGHAASRAKGKRRGLGLTNMRERAAALGGTFEAQFTPKEGTTIVVRVPAP
jgi:PAS domain S-box-containing protein